MKLFHYFKRNKFFCTNKGATILISMKEKNTQQFNIDGERLLKEPHYRVIPSSPNSDIRSRIGSYRQHPYHRKHYHQSQEL